MEEKSSSLYLIGNKQHDKTTSCQPYQEEGRRIMGGPNYLDSTILVEELTTI